MTVEPRVMQVLIVLSGAFGEVVSRAELIHRCWDDRIVGEDAVNRAIAEVRRAARAVEAEFEVETLPRIGWRLSGEALRPEPMATAIQPTAKNRRAVLAGAAVAVASGGAWLLARSWPLTDSNATRAARLVEKAHQVNIDGMPDSERQGVSFLTQAAALDPDNAAIWGKLALAHRAVTEYAEPGEVAAAVAATETTARRALAIDPRQANAQAALALLPEEFGDWFGAERRYRAVLALEPGNLAMHAAMGILMQSVGRVRDASRHTLVLLAAEPLSPVYNYRRAYNLWSLGDAAAADVTIERALKLWPLHPGVWLARLWLFALTGRPAAAGAMLAEPANRIDLPPRYLAMLQHSMTALQTRAPYDVRVAVADCLSATAKGPSAAVWALMILQGLDEMDAAFDVARGYFLRQGPEIGPLRRSSGQPAINDLQRRKTMMLFLGGTAPLRADPRFLQLARDIGLTDYWRASRTRPDFLGNRPLQG